MMMAEGLTIPDLAAYRRIEVDRREARTDESKAMNVTSIASMMTNLKSAEQTSAIQYAVAAKIMQSERAEGDAAVQLIEAAGATMDQALSSAGATLASQLDLLA